MKRRNLVLGAGAVAPVFFVRTIARADPLTEGLVEEVSLLTDNLSLRPAGNQRGFEDRQIAGGGTLFAQTVREQARMMDSGFPVIEQSSIPVREVSANRTGYVFARFSESRRNCCLPLGYMRSQDVSTEYRGAMTLLEGPNLVAVRVVTTLLRQRNYSSDQIMQLVWPVRPSVPERRERAMIGFRSISSLPRQDNDNDVEYYDRDVLHAELADCTVRYGHENGVPNGSGEGALIVNRVEELRFEFDYDTAIGS